MQRTPHHAELPALDQPVEVEVVDPGPADSPKPVESAEELHPERIGIPVDGDTPDRDLEARSRLELRRQTGAGAALHEHHPVHIVRPEARGALVERRRVGRSMDDPVAGTGRHRESGRELDIGSGRDGKPLGEPPVHRGAARAVACTAADGCRGGQDAGDPDHRRSAPVPHDTLSSSDLGAAGMPTAVPSPPDR